MHQDNVSTAHGESGPGDLTQAGTDALYQALYAELKREAKRARRGSALFQTTALVNEAYFKLRNSDQWNDRQHFLRTAAVAMRQVIVDEARTRLAAKRGGDKQITSLDQTGFVETVGSVDAEPELLIGVDRALASLSALNPRLTQVVECRYFAGYSEQETADLLECTPRTVRRDWVKAKAFLFDSLADHG